MEKEQHKEFVGIVQRGAKRGAELGFPTANIPLADTSVSGIHVARVKIGEEQYDAVVYADPHRGVLEAHVLDFGADLYGWNVHVRLLKKLRDGRKFDTVDALQKAIAKDIQDARAFFAHLR